MLTTHFLRSMSRPGLRAIQRSKIIARHMMSTTAPEPTVLFESNQSLRKYILNRPTKLNALDEEMLGVLRPKIEEWASSDLCGIILAAGNGRAFCAGGDVAGVVENAQDPETRPRAIDFFKKEFEMDYILAALKKPYVVVMDGYTMGGGVGLTANAPFRIATEKTVFAMPETKIGYCPDVGASYFLSRLDGEIGTYLALTSDSLYGRAVFELGCATHYIPSRRVPTLIDRLSALEKPQLGLINQTIEELSSERQAEEPPTPFTGPVRAALDYAFRHDDVEGIVDDLGKLSKHRDPEVQKFAGNTLEVLQLRSPTSLKIALRTIRQGKKMTLREALNMELKIASAFCNGASPDFATGVNAVIKHKSKDRPQWNPATLKEVTEDIIDRFFNPSSEYLASAPVLDIPPQLNNDVVLPMRFALPTEEEIGHVVNGSHTSGGATSISLEELVSRFNDLRSGKMGVREKIVEVASRRCEIKDNADGNMVWLKWKRQPTPP